MTGTKNTQLLACDLDGTMYPTGPDPTHVEALADFGRLRAGAAGLRVAYVTGRHLASALEAMDHWSLPPPDLMSCDVGTAVYVPDGGQWRPDEAYAARLREAMGGLGNAGLLDLLSGVPGLAPQAAERQAEFKTSFTLPRGDAGDAALRAAAARLATTGTAFSLVRSTAAYEDQDLLDVLPPGATKSTALLHMAGLLDVDPARTLFAGDSRNDLDPLLEAGRGIVVANAQRDLREALRPHLADASRADAIYLAQRPHLHGVLEGCRHFGVTAETPR
jgi:HAD superfamily hydrolase (TIGR01484 family)